MLGTRLVVGTSLIAVLVALGCLDHRSTMPGVWLGPALVVLAILATQELLQLLRAKGVRPIATTVHLGTLLVLLSPWVPLGFALAGCVAPEASVASGGPAASHGAGDGFCLEALAVAVILAVVGELARYEAPGRVTADLAAAVFAVVYLGFLLSFMVRLRLDWGMGALASMLIVVKMGDTGAYFVGKAIGRHRMAPRVSPNKTVEGAIGAIVFACSASWAVFQWLVPAALPHGAEHPRAMTPAVGAMVFGVLVGAAGMLGDLAESLLKRDAACKDSSAWMPGLGGVLDMLDSLLVAAPVAYACWRLGWIG
jgi:phosphatidate cytidylyltransferase